MDEVHGIEFFFGVMSVEFTISGRANPHPGQLPFVFYFHGGGAPIVFSYLGQLGAV